MRKPDCLLTVLIIRSQVLSHLLKHSPVYATLLKYLQWIYFAIHFSFAFEILLDILWATFAKHSLTIYTMRQLYKLLVLQNLHSWASIFLHAVSFPLQVHLK